MSENAGKTLTLKEYVDATRCTKWGKPIEDRWTERIWANSWQMEGAVGAAEYLNRFGHNISAEKCHALGSCALQHGYAEMAYGFFKRAAEIDGCVLMSPEHDRFAVNHHTSLFSPWPAIVDMQNSWKVVLVITNGNSMEVAQGYALFAVDVLNKMGV
jgi:hypothetical protein